MAGKEKTPKEQQRPPRSATEVVDPWTGRPVSDRALEALRTERGRR